MKTKVFLLLACGLLYAGQNLAQTRNVYLYKYSGQEVKIRDSADYIRMISEPDSGSVLFNVKEVYLKNYNLKLVGKTSKDDRLFLEGKCITYYPSGMKREIANYKEGVEVGDAYEYYPNGKLYTYKQYTPSNVNTGAAFGTAYLIMAANDSTGKQLVVDGNGYYIGFHDDFKTINEEGNIKAGLRDGIWKGGNKDTLHKISFTEEYDNGKLLKGQSVDENRVVLRYTVRDKMPEFKGGVTAFSQYLGKKVRYPANAVKNKIQGRVFLSFVVDKDGSLKDVKVVKSPDDELSAEAQRVLRESPQWVPGLQYGRPVRVSYTVPINFSLGN